MKYGWMGLYELLEIENDELYFN